MTGFFRANPAEKHNLDINLRITIIGDDVAGKTGIFRSILDKPFTDEYISTPGIDFSQLNRMSGQTCVALQCWDTSLRPTHIQFALQQTIRSDLIILVIDSTMCSGDWTEAITAKAKKFSLELYNNAQVLIVFSKTDLVDDTENLPSDDQIRCALSDQNDLATRIIGAVAVSAKTGNNIDKLLLKIETLALSKRTQEEHGERIQVGRADSRTPLLRNKDNPDHNRSKCCC